MLLNFCTGVVQIYPTVAPKQIVVNAMGDAEFVPTLRMGDTLEHKVDPSAVHPVGSLTIYEWLIRVAPLSSEAVVFNLASRPAIDENSLGRKEAHEIRVSPLEKGCGVLVNGVFVHMDEYDPNWREPTPLEKRIADVVSEPVTVFDCVIDDVI